MGWCTDCAAPYTTAAPAGTTTAALGMENTAARPLITVPPTRINVCSAKAAGAQIAQLLTQRLHPLEPPLLLVAARAAACRLALLTVRLQSTSSAPRVAPRGVRPSLCRW